MLELLSLGKLPKMFERRDGVGISAQSPSNQDIAQSQSLLVTVPAEWIWVPGPRLLGSNPSLDMLARVTFHLSNKLWMDWGSAENSWFLHWLGVSADVTLLKTFFSMKTPTVCAAYQVLCKVASRFRQSTTARVLFETQDTIRKNSPLTADAIDFLSIAVEIGSRADGMLEVAIRALTCSASWYGRSHRDRGQRLRQLILSAAACRDTPMMRSLVEALGDCHDEAHLDGDDAIRRISFIMRQIYAWDLEEVKDGYTMEDYIQPLVQVGILSPSLSARCCYDDRPEVPIRNPESITIDELVMICPPEKRRHLYSVLLSCSHEHRTSISKAGVFTAALNGAQGLLDYLRSRRQDDTLDTRATMQECLVFAASLNDIQTVSALLQLKVDPEVGLLANNKERYRNGDSPWNPMIIAAAAGNLEALELLKETNNLVQFLNSVPVYEICQVENAQTKYWDMTGRELRRLENLRRHLLFSHTKNSDAAVASGTVYIPLLRFNGLLSPGQDSENARSRFFIVEKRRVETIACIRNIAAAHGVGPRIDKQIIEAALFNEPETWALQGNNAPYNPCDVLLLDGLVDANLEYHEGDMDLLQLCIRSQCRLAVVEFLLSKGFHVHSRPAAQSGKTMLHDALLSRSCDRSKIVYLLLRKGAYYHHVPEGLTILEASLHRDFSQSEGPCSDYLDIFTHLFQTGAPVRYEPRTQPEGWNPLVCQLLRAGAEDDLILRVADAGAELNERGHVGRRATPLVEAIFGRREKLAKQLIQRGADVHAPAGDDGGCTALQAACWAGSSFQFIEYLIKVKGANVNEAPSENGGMTALQFSTMHRSLSLVELLLDHGADINALSGRFGYFPGWIHDRRRVLDLAAEIGTLDMVEFLLKAGARSATTGLGRAIDLSKVHGHFAVLSVLLEWEKLHGRRMLEEEDEWQQQHPDAANLLFEQYSDDDLASGSDTDDLDGLIR